MPIIYRCAVTVSLYFCGLLRKSYGSDIRAITTCVDFFKTSTKVVTRVVTSKRHDDGHRVTLSYATQASNVSLEHTLFLFSKKSLLVN